MKKTACAAAALIAVFVLVFSACNEENENTKEFTVTFSVDATDATWPDGSAADISVKVKANSTIGDKMPPVPKRGNETFTGWENIEGGIFDETTKVDRNIYVEASWGQNRIDVANSSATISSNGSGAGEYQIGKKLTVTPNLQYELEVPPTSGNITYSWRGNGSTIPDSGNSSTYTITGDAAGKKITCVIAHTGAPGNSITAEGKTVPFNIDSAFISIVDGVEAVFAGNDFYVSAQFAQVDEEFTLHYTLDGTKKNNKITFSGVTVPSIIVPGTGTVQAKITSNDIFAAVDGVITIRAVFENSDAALLTTKIDFENDTIDSANDYKPLTGGSPTVIANPNKTTENSSEKALRITASNYHNGAAIPVNLQHQLRKYKSISGQFNIVTGSSLTYKTLAFVAAKNVSALQTGAVLETNVINILNNYITDAADVTAKTGTWTPFTISIPDVAPGSTWGDLSGECFIAIGINHNNITYLLDNIEFLYEPVPIWIWSSRAVFDKNTADVNYGDINFTIETNDVNATFSELKAGTVTIDAANYTQNGNVLTLKKEYLTTLAINAESPINFVFSDSSTKTINITIRDTGGIVIPATYNVSLTNAVANGGDLSGNTGTLVRFTASADYGNSYLRVPVTLPEGTSLSNYNRITLTFNGVSGDVGSKNLRVCVTTNVVSGWQQNEWFNTDNNISTSKPGPMVSTGTSNVVITIDKTMAVVNATGTLQLYFCIFGNNNAVWEISNVVINKE